LVLAVLLVLHIARLSEHLLDLVGMLAPGFGMLKEERFELLVLTLVTVNAAFCHAQVFHLQGVFKIITLFLRQTVLIRQIWSPPIFC
jgi:hypothetical protein